MGLADAHKGYEYQDLFSAFHIVNTLLENNYAICKIDRKETANDKFDDFTIILKDLVIKRQIKYSENKILEKSDLSTENYDLALDVLFNSWKELPKDKNIDIRLCLAWKYLSDSKDLDFLYEVEMKNTYDECEVKLLKIDLDTIWPYGKQPISSWKRLRSKVSNINRDEFSRFIDDLRIEVNLPKSSADLTNPGELEKLLIDKLKLFGVGKYPNDKKNVVDVAMHLMHIIKRARAKGELIEVEKLIYELGLITSYGNIEQEFRINKEINIPCVEQCLEFKDFLFENNKVCLVGAPGSGKSWFIQNLKEFMKGLNISIVQHYCYIGLNDIHDQERITVNIFLANLLNDLIESMPYLAENKTSKYGVDFDELQLLIGNIKEELVIIVDGLDHISRTYNLHKEIMKEIDTEIIQVISKLNLPNNVKIILSSQPIKELSYVYVKDFKEYVIKPWGISEVKEFISKNQISDMYIDHMWLSELLLDKSSGNPLYLSYLINELHGYSDVIITKKLIDTFPGYDNNLEKYYSFVMTKLSESQRVPQILAGSPFPLTEAELNEITYLGNYVAESLVAIRSILTFNKCSGGYMIYHESFRRYILELLDKNRVSIENAIYLPLIDWLKRRGFYKDKKSYLNLFVLLFESKRYNEILEYCCKEFVIGSVYYGNDILSLKKNYSILLKAACIEKDYVALTKCTELNNMIYSLDYSFDENAYYYYWGLGLIYGFDNLKNTLVYEGKSTLTYEQGLKVCYLCSKNNVIPDWDKYINKLLEAEDEGNDYNYNEQDKYKYYICACLDTGQNMIDILKNISEEEDEDYRQTVLEEYSRRNHIGELKDSISKLKYQESWINSINVFLGEKEINEQYVDIALEKLKHSDSYSDDTLAALNYYFCNIGWIIANHTKKIDEFISSIKNRNWYYNWLIFIYKISFAIKNKQDANIDEDKVVEAYSWLAKDMECFKGEPRTCDLYKFSSIIYESIMQPLKNIKQASTWKNVLATIETMSSNTMTSLSGAIGGPLPSHKLFDLFIDIANETNIDLLADIFEKRIEDESNRRIYPYLADYSIKYAIILVKSNKVDEAKKKFRKGVEYLLSYSSRRDRTLSHLIDSVESIYKIDKKIGIEYTMKLAQLVNSVLYHTDGKDTDTYQREWFEVLTKENRGVALTCLTYDLLDADIYWLLEECLDDLLEVTNSEIDPVVENILFKTRPNNTKPNFIKAYLHNISNLITNNQIYLARQSMLELLGRFSEGVSNDNYCEIKKLCEILGIEKEIVIQSEMSINKSSSRSRVNKKDNERSMRSSSFDEMTNEKVLEYITIYGVNASELQGLYYYFQSIQELNNETKMFFDNLIRHTFERESHDETRKRILLIIDNLSMDSAIMAFIYISMFMNHKDGWYQRLTKKEYYIKAVAFNKEVTEQYFFDFFYYNMASVEYSYAVGGEIVNALTEADFDGNLVIQCWDALYEIIDFRLSGQYEYHWKEIIEASSEFNDREKMIFLVLSRLKYAETNRYTYILAGLDNMLKSSEYRLCFIKPFQYYLKRYGNILEYSIVMLLLLILRRFTKSELNEHNLKKSILDIYPTNNETINYLIRCITGKKKQRIYQKYRASYVAQNEKIKWCIHQLGQVDNRLGRLEKIGVNIGNIVEKYMEEVLAEGTRKELQGILYDRLYSVIVSNVYFYDMLMRDMSYEVNLFINQFAGTMDAEYFEELAYEIVLDDINYIISICNSNSIRPSDIKLPAESSTTIEDIEMGEWVRIAYYERWYNKRKKHKGSLVDSNDSCLVFSGIGFTEKEDDIPILMLEEDYHLFDENDFLYNGIFDIKSIIMTDAKIYEDIYLTYRTNAYLGLRGDILNALGVKLLDRGDGIIGMNREGETVLRYSIWQKCFDDIDTENYRIPYLVGAELKIKRNVFEKICRLFKTQPKCYTIKIE